LISVELNTVCGFSNLVHLRIRASADTNIGHSEETMILLIIRKRENSYSTIYFDFLKKYINIKKTSKYYTITKLFSK